MVWFTTDIRTLVGQPWAEIVLALTALICGAIVGAERRRKEKPAGMRTMMLVSLGSAVFTMMSIVLIAPNGDPARIAAQIVSGVGFLGAGAIMRGPLGVTGMTTAASVWVVAAIGMAVGGGYPLAGLGLSGLVFAVQTAVSAYSSVRLRGAMAWDVVIRFEPDGGKGNIRLAEVFHEHRISFNPAELLDTTPGLKQIRIPIGAWDRRDQREFLVHLAELRDVKEVRLAEAAEAPAAS